MTLAYATEQTKGRLVALFWCVLAPRASLISTYSHSLRCIFNAGAVLGSAIQLGLTYESGTANTVSNAVYAAFLVISSLGACIPFFLVRRCPPLIRILADEFTRLTPEQWSASTGAAFRFL